VVIELRRDRGARGGAVTYLHCNIIWTYDPRVIIFLSRDDILFVRALLELQMHHKNRRTAPDFSYARDRQ